MTGCKSYRMTNAGGFNFVLEVRSHGYVYQYEGKFWTCVVISRLQSCRPRELCRSRMPSAAYSLLFYTFLPVLGPLGFVRPAYFKLNEATRAD